MIFDKESASDAQNIVAPPNHLFIDFTLNLFGKKNRQKKFFGVEKWNVGNRLKRVFPKFRADRSLVWGVNGRSKFRKGGFKVP